MRKVRIIGAKNVREEIVEILTIYPLLPLLLLVLLVLFYHMTFGKVKVIIILSKIVVEKQEETK